MVNSTLTFSNVIGHICSDLGSWFDPYMIMDGIFKRYEVYLCISPTMATLAGVVCLCLSKPWDCLRPFLLGALKVAGALRKSSGAKEKKQNGGDGSKDSVVLSIEDVGYVWLM